MFDRDLGKLRDCIDRNYGAAIETFGVWANEMGGELRSVPRTPAPSESTPIKVLHYRCDGHERICLLRGVSGRAWVVYSAVNIAKGSVL